MKILLLKTWTQNIGNGFIDMGAKEAISRAFPDADVIEISGHPNYIGSRVTLGPTPTTTSVISQLSQDPVMMNLIKLAYNIYKKGDNIKNSVTDIIGEKNSSVTSEFIPSKLTRAQKNIVNVGEHIDADLAVLPGCTLYPPVLEAYKNTLVRLRNKGIPLIFLGSGGGNYEKSTRRYINSMINSLDPAAMISRDTLAYDHYGHKFPFSYDGIDCAFFINEWYSPPSMDIDYNVHNFDKINDPLDQSGAIIRTKHTPHTNINNSLERFEKRGLFFSDEVKDYLTIYANASKVYSDRIHACVPTLAYGGEAQFFYDTPRSKLFDRILDENIQEELVSANQDKMVAEKEAQIEAIKNAASVALSR